MIGNINKRDGREERKWESRGRKKRKNQKKRRGKRRKREFKNKRETSVCGREIMCSDPDNNSKSGRKFRSLADADPNPKYWPAYGTHLHRKKVGKRRIERKQLRDPVHGATTDGVKIVCYNHCGESGSAPEPYHITGSGSDTSLLETDPYPKNPYQNAVDPEHWL